MVGPLPEPGNLRRRVHLGERVLSYSLWFIHIERTGASAAAFYLNLVPIFGFMFAAGVLRESVSVELIIGGMLTVAGCTASGKKNREH